MQLGQSLLPIGGGVYTILLLEYLGEVSQQLRIVLHDEQACTVIHVVHGLLGMRLHRLCGVLLVRLLDEQGRMRVIMLLTHGEPHVEVRPLVELTAHLNLSLHVLDVSAYRKQADATSRHLCIDGVAATEQLVEQFLLLLFVNPYPAVCHMESPYLLLFVESHCDGALLTAILDSV